MGKLEDDNGFETWLEQGIIEEVKNEETVNTGYYLPHTAVIKESSTTNIRPVFDASGKAKGSHSLNDCLGKGPKFNRVDSFCFDEVQIKAYWSYLRY